MPSSLAFSGDDNIALTLRPPTMLHPRLDEVASGVAHIVWEKASSWIHTNEERFAEGGAIE